MTGSGAQSSQSPDSGAAARIVVVTGASRGIGAAVAVAMAAAGDHVVLAARSVGVLQAVAASIEESGGQCTVVPTDATRIEDLDQLVHEVGTRFGRLDVLVNNAGVLPVATFADQMSVEEWQRAIALNLTAPWYLASRCKQLMTRTGRGGVVINVSSSASLYPSVGFSAYNASKAGLTMVTKTLALEWARDAIRVVAIAPGKVDTDLVQPVLAYGKRRNIRVNPLGRIGAPSEVADLVQFLASDKAAFITGSVITIDGGEVAATGADLAR